ncbi:hypothetical protein JCGZ_01497 [Jatropha curcas]|uniref:Putative zinc-finger domain-containing protein n=1 Tax=Jatropha curcas TaxID=180498 RepID=A0A067L9A3_JATCU|nr:uncharacterized protein LOC105647962 [Jatropha curcas]KDP44997.1 hypothetical protein JCGZ_01497 [Jatropha curcas]
MESRDEIKKIQSDTLNPCNSENPNPPQLLTKIREEGELSSSTDGEEYPAGSATQSAGSVNPPVLPGPIPIPPFNKFSEGIQARKSTLGINPANSVDIQSQTSVQPNNDKSFEKNQVPVKSANPGWLVPPRGNTNLVISFSDDDSGSESDDYRAAKNLKIKQDTAGVNGNRRVPSLVSAKSSKLQQAARNVNRVMPKKSSLSRTFISSTKKINGGAHSGSTGPSTIDQGSRVRNFNSTNRNFASQEHGFDQGVGLNNTKLQDLRQQIALRERELKLKAAHQNKESASVSGRDYAVMSLGADAVRKSNATSDVRQLEAEEPVRKRFKTSGTQLRSDRRQEIFAVKSTRPFKEQALESSTSQDRSMVDHSQEGSPTRRAESGVVKWQKQYDKRADISLEKLPSGLKNGANSSSYCTQTDMSSKQVDPHVLLNQTAPVINIDSSVLPKNTNITELNHPVKICGQQLPGSSLQTRTGEKHLINGCDYREGTNIDSTVEPSSNNIFQTSLNDVNHRNYLGAPILSEHSTIDMHSLVEVEESLDKELEEAQEQRRICEIEERNALKAYRKAQRALVEANARCTELYHKRELYSAQFRSFLLSDSSLLWSARKQEHAVVGLNHADNKSKNLELMLPSNHSRRAEYDGHNQPVYDSNVQCANGAPLNMSYRHVNGQNLGSEPCSEPDASTSEPLHINSKNLGNLVSSPSNDHNISVDEDEETSPLGHETVQPNFKNKQTEPNSLARQNDIHNHSNSNFSNDGSQDSLILEATLRSALFARLGSRILSKNSGLTNSEPANDLGTENDNGSERTQTSNGSAPLSEAEKNQEFDLKGNGLPRRNIDRAPKTHKEKDNEYSIGAHQSTAVISSPTSVLRSAFGHMKVMSPFTSAQLEIRKNRQGDTCGYYNEAAGCINSGDVQQSILTSNSVEESVREVCENENGSFTCDLAVDPFWPLCMYELRGKCNNDQCPWQHVRDFSSENIGQHEHNDSDCADCQVKLRLHGRKYNGATALLNCPNVLTLPTYQVGLEILKADPHSYESIVARRNGQCWQKSFSICVALSNFILKDLPADEPLLHGNDGRIEVNGSWDKQSSYFQSRNIITNHLNQVLPTNVQSLEMAILILSQEVNKPEGMNKALSALSRAIEADPKSEILWISYLLIYYGNVRSMAKEDMFSYAVKHNDRSYGLWLMYINSRLHLDDRLDAYDAALTALCRHSSTYVKDEMYASACILDLFLQMMDCLCMSGNVEKGIERICALFPVATNSDEPHSSLLSDILACLTISDKFMFWVCCVYLVIYRKLPEAIVQKFECDKELLAIEWPYVHLVEMEKQRAMKLVEMAVDSVKVYANSESLGNETNLRSAQHFGVCHIRCMVVLEGLECCSSLLDDYMKMFPSCLEFTLISARIQMTYFEDTSFEGFEEALRNWPKETPGIHCIWNQYIECAFQKGHPDFAKELIVRWFDSFSEVQHPQKGKLDAKGTNSTDESLDLTSASNPDFLTSNSNNVDMTFGYLNLSLFKLLHSDHFEARNAMDKAFKAASAPFFKHCLREHAMFLFTYESQLKGDASISCHLNVLNGYLDDARALPPSEPLSRLFMNKIEKPRVRQLISNILSPVSYDFSLVNLVLEMWHGPSLIPQTFSQPKELVDFVEAILEIVPSNYQLAISACKLLSRGEQFTEMAPGSMLYWASSALVNAIFHAVPIAPEYIWIDAAGILDGIAGIDLISERFYKRALSVYPFSIKLWNRYYNISKTRGDASSVLEAARGKGIGLG